MILLQMEIVNLWLAGCMSALLTHVHLQAKEFRLVLAFKGESRVMDFLKVIQLSTFSVVLENKS